MNNPFTLTFGVKPNEYIPRSAKTDEVITAFEQDPPLSSVYMITGVRGNGKTVMLSDISSHFKASKNWTIIELSIERDLLHSFAAKLYNSRKYQKLFLKAKLNFSLLGLGLEIENAPPITDLETAIERMLDEVKKAGGRILIAIDEAANTKSMREFASVFQILLRNEYPVYLLMTGLYENIYDLQNTKTLTFLYRAPRIELTPLNITSIADSYQKIFHNSNEEANKMAALTNGYSYAYQVVGYLCFREKTYKVTDDILRLFDSYMAEYAYDKIYAETSNSKRVVLKAMAQCNSDLVTDIRELTGFATNEFSTYRLRLIRSGLVAANGNGHIVFTLPRFKEYILSRAY